MPRFKVAHVREQGVDLIIIPMESSFGNRLKSDQDEVIAELQIRARNAGLAGTVVPVWEAGGGRMAFIAPSNWHPFFGSMSMYQVLASVNREIYW